MNPTPDRLPSRPLRNWFLAWHIHTGDAAEVIAKGFDLDVEVVADLLSGDVPLMLDALAAVDTCRRIRVVPEALWLSTQPCVMGPGREVDDPWSDVPAPMAETIRHLR